MINTLKKCKEKLNVDINYLAQKNATEKAIFLGTENTVPKVSAFPALLLKDGSETYNNLDGTQDEKTLHIEVTIFVQLLKTEGAITGDGLTKGVLEVADDVKASLRGFKPDGEEGWEMDIASSAPSQTLSNERKMVRTKKLTFKYIKDEQR
ncbi:MAG: hypothetical protein KAV87_20805 [Desulfobacteraceae bacterium]|nr:hypothetical protein [Desulfobacteraceae bacterium]